MNVAPPLRACPQRSRRGGTCRAQQAAKKLVGAVMVSATPFHHHPGAQGATPPHLRRGATRNSPPNLGGVARRAPGWLQESPGVVTFAPPRWFPKVKPFSAASQARRYTRNQHRLNGRGGVGAARLDAGHGPLRHKVAPCCTKPPCGKRRPTSKPHPCRLFHSWDFPRGTLDAHDMISGIL